MPVDFLRRFGGRRMTPYGDQPRRERPAEDDDPDGHGIDRGLEQAPEEWRAIDVGYAEPSERELPRRFVDGSHIHETVAWARGPQGHPVPVMLAEIGGICMRAEDASGRRGRELVREFEIVERIVCMIVDPFPWNEVEEFAGGLADAGLRLLAARPPENEDGSPIVCFDFERMRDQTRFTCGHAMSALEEVAWRQRSDVPTLVDGRLTRFHHRAVAQSDVIGVIKRQHGDYLHEEGWRLLYSLEPGQRTPAFKLSTRNLSVATWYLKLDGPDGAMPNWGIVRIEIPMARFDQTGGDFAHFDRVSSGILDMRCRSSTYGRRPVSLEPIVRAEESLKSLFTPLDALTQRFYRMTGL